MERVCGVFSGAGVGVQEGLQIFLSEYRFVQWMGGRNEENCLGLSVSVSSSL